MSDAELKWEGREDYECGEHTTTNDRTWCLEDKEWCYPDAPCRGCELPVLRAEVERLRAASAKLALECAAQHEELERLRVLLKRYEWSAVSAFGDRVCPFCEATQQEGHGHSANPHSPRSCWLEAKP